MKASCHCTLLAALADFQWGGFVLWSVVRQTGAVCLLRLCHTQIGETAMTEESVPVPAPQQPATEFFPPTDDPEILRVLAIGSREVVNIFVHRLHQANIAHFNEWSRLLPTPNPGEVMRILTKRISIDRSEAAP
ncbi:MAG: hypothetical protein F6K28_60625 [Microcoleus sp. SIO2G3]|nr:hypothetical protein [Microcoleus sp. SIO2G3]